MPVKYENYITGDDSAGSMFGVLWESQTFTPSVEHTITSVKLKMQRAVGSPGTITVSIRATSSSLPTGADLASGTTDGNTLTTDSGGEWREITLGAGTLLLSETEYAIVGRVLGGDGSNAVNWRTDNFGSYSRGERATSDNSGSSWSAASGHDLMFEEWGDATETPVVTTQAVTSIVSTTATGNGNVTDLGGSSVTQHGHCWNTGGLPTTSDSKTTNGSKATTGTFTSSLTSLTSGTLYYVRAYATNTDGTSYGDEVSFTAGSPRGGELSGLYAVVEERFHYVDAYGVERFIQGTVVT